MQHTQNFTVQTILPGIVTVLGGVCNRSVIANQGHVLVIDAGISVAEATFLRSVANEQHAGGSLALFNTHTHIDHIGGNQVFADMPIIAQTWVRENLVQNGPQLLANMQKNPQMATLIGEITLTPPTLVFQETLTLFVGEIEVQLKYFGTAHSPSDSVAWLPQSKTLFTGDLLFNDMVPAMPPGANTANWLVALRSLEQLGAEQVIPGHGPIQPPQALNTLRQWMELLQEQVGNALAQGWDRETALARIPDSMQASAPRTFTERLPNAIGLAYDEILHGTS